MSQQIVAIVILNWNKKYDTAECLSSVYRMTNQKFDVFLVDNGSTDGSVSFLNKQYPRVHYIQNEKNVGYATGNNIGIKEALKEECSFILLLNNDTIVDSNLLTESLKTIELSDKIGMVGAVNYYYSDRKNIQFSGGCMDWYRGNIFDITRHQEDRNQFPEYRQVDAISGSCMLIRKEVFERIDLFDERFFLNYEDTDLCCRAKRAGYKIFTSMKAHIWHKVSLSFKNNSFIHYFIARNKPLFLIKNCPKQYLGFSISYHIIYTFLNVFKCIREGERNNSIAMLLGIRDAILGKYYVGSMARLINR